jgi:hypothetical protein
MTESPVRNLEREIQYNKLVFELLNEKGIDHLVHYDSSGRTVEAKTGVAGLAILIKTAPMPDGKVLLVVKPTNMKPFVETIDERLLKQRLHKWIGDLL